MWDADEVDTLIRTHYAFLWETYKDVRYSVMRADVGRAAVLHRYEGLYSDLDVFPNRCSYRQVPFAVRMRPSRLTKPGSQPTFLDMEVIVGNANHPMLLKWLHFMVSEIARFKFDHGFWRVAKCGTSGTPRVRYA